MSGTTTPDDAALTARLKAHHATFSPIYRGYLSDHGPMAALAFRGLGASAGQVIDYLERYEKSLEPLATADAGYVAELETFTHACTTEGVETVLTRELPALISGWARDAYHPLIRIGYGYEFGLPEEVAAGLAYLKWCGPDRTIETLATTARATQPVAAFEAMQTCASSVTPERNFTSALAMVVRHPQFASAALTGPDVLHAVSRLALSAFAATANFFALHLVTGAHAYRVLYPFAGVNRDPIFSLGILGGYAAIGAPPFEILEDEPGPTVPDPFGALLCQPQLDEHDIKLAWSATKQAGFFSDPTFTAVAACYLEGRNAV